MQPKVITLTVNPVVDKNVSVNGISANTKLRCTSPTYDPGGGGINISRALKNLGGNSLCIYFAGGPNGTHLKQLLDDRDIDQIMIPIKGWTRDYLSVTDTTTNQKYRFGIPGPNVEKKEWEAILMALDKHLNENDYLVASGKLSSGMPDNFYTIVSDLAQKRKAKFIVDTSEKALIESVKSQLFMLKPSLGELSALCGIKNISVLELENIAKKFLAEHDCQVLVTSLGAKGAFLATNNQMEYIAAPTVHEKNTIGAGDSMVAGMIMSLLDHKNLSDSVKYGVACGTSATMYEGTQLCNKQDADKLYQWIKAQK
tara:strand:+ start:40424 stop:41362 length:939 start_codon:yes stop_codon:yes gene_type:complete